MEKLRESWRKGKRECVPADRWVFPLTINEDRHFSNLTDSSRILSNYRPAIRRRIFSKICHGPVFANPLPRLKLGSSDANSSNVINHTADFWVALRRSRRFPILIILKIERYIFFYYICEEIVIILL